MYINRPTETIVALRKESVDRNLNAMQIVVVVVKSLSARRAWIEIMDDFEPSTTRRLSLSARRAWIEIKRRTCHKNDSQVALRKESVDRNLAS